MKKDKFIKRILTLLLCAAMMVAYLPSSVYSSTDESAESLKTTIESEKAAPAEEKDKAGEPEKPVEEAKPAEETAPKEEAAPKEDTAPKEETTQKEDTAPKEDAAPAEETEQAEEAEEANEPAVTEEGSVSTEEPIGSEEVSSERKSLSLTKTAETEADETKAEKPDKVTVKVHVFAWDANGNYTEVYTATKANLSSGAASWYIPTYMDAKVTNKTVVKDGKTYKFSSGSWKYANGTQIPKTKADGTGSGSYYAITFDDAAEKAVDGIADYSIYAGYRQDITVTLIFKDIKHTDGTTTSSSQSNTLSGGGGWNFTKKKLEQTTGLTSGTVISYMGYEYAYTGQWKDGNGNVIDASSSISIKNAAGTTEGNNYYIDEDTTIEFSPIYKPTKINGLDYQYIDNISTGSGSWSNADAFDYRSKFGSLTHTYRNPEIASPTLTPHYSFRYWQTDKYEYTYTDGSKGSNSSEIGKRYKDGDTGTYTLISADSHGTIKETEVDVYAYWQPSVTVRYHYNGKEVEDEKFADITVYEDAASVIDSYSADGNTLTIDGEEYAGWYDAEGNLLSADKVYSAPGITKVPVERTVYDVYAKKPITVKAADNTWVYDGIEHADNGTSVTVGSLIGDDAIEAENTGRITDKGTVDNEVGEITITRDGKDVTSYYLISFEKGSLTVTPAPLKIATQSATKVYDGTALTRTDGTISGLVNDETATVTGTGSQIAVGSSKNGYTINWGTAKEFNYEIASEDLGTLTVTAAYVPGDNDDADDDDDDDSDNDNDNDNDNPNGGNPVGRRTPRGGGNGSGAVPAGAAGATTVLETQTPTTVPPTTDIVDPAPPLAAGAWALINLICAIVTALGAVIALFRRKEEEEDEEEDQNSAENKNASSEEDDEEDDNRGKKMLAAKIAGAIAGIAGPVVFILTEDMTLPMQMIDKWTLLMVVILVAQVIAAIFNKKASEFDDKEEEEAEA